MPFYDQAKLLNKIYDATNNAIMVELFGGSGSAASSSSAAALTNVSSSASTGVLLALNLNRKRATFFNDSTANLFLAPAATASLTSFTVKIAAGGYYEFPDPIYTGAIAGIWDAANGAVRVTELT